MSAEAATDTYKYQIDLEIISTRSVFQIATNPDDILDIETVVDEDAPISGRYKGVNYSVSSGLVSGLLDLQIDLEVTEASAIVGGIADGLVVAKLTVPTTPSLLTSILHQVQEFSQGDGSSEINGFGIFNSWDGSAWFDNGFGYNLRCNDASAIACWNEAVPPSKISDFHIPGTEIYAVLSGKSFVTGERLGPNPPLTVASLDANYGLYTQLPQEVPLPAAAWLFLSAIAGLGILKRVRK